MRTKTLTLSAVLTALGTASLVAQTNVYSLNAVGYINAVMPPGYSILTCPLIMGTDTEYAGAYGGNPVTNDLNVVLNNDSGVFAGALVTQFNDGAGFGNSDAAASAAAGGGWSGSSSLPAGPWGASGQSDIGQGVNLIPGTAVFFRNPSASANMTAVFAGTVPQGSLTNLMVPGFNLVGSIVPTSGDFVANTITAGFFANTVNSNGPGAGYQPQGNQGPAFGDLIEGYASGNYFGNGAWSGSWSGGEAPSGGPEVSAPYTGIFYYNAGKDDAVAQTINGYAAPAGTELWIENFSVSP